MNYIKECFNRGILSKEEYTTLSNCSPQLDEVLDILVSSENVEIIGYCLNLLANSYSAEFRVQVGNTVTQKLNTLISKNVDTLDMLALKFLPDIDMSNYESSEYANFLAYMEKKLEKYAEGQEIIYWALQDSSKANGFFYNYAKKSPIWTKNISTHICSSRNQIQYYIALFLWKLSFERGNFIQFCW